VIDLTSQGLQKHELDLLNKGPKFRISNELNEHTIDAMLLSISSSIIKAKRQATSLTSVKQSNNTDALTPPQDVNVSENRHLKILVDFENLIKKHKEASKR